MTDAELLCGCLDIYALNQFANEVQQSMGEPDGPRKLIEMHWPRLPESSVTIILEETICSRIVCGELQYAFGQRGNLISWPDGSMEWRTWK